MRLFHQQFRPYRYIVNPVLFPLSFFRPIAEVISPFQVGSSFTIDGIGLGAVQGTVVLGGISQTITGWSDTQITGSVVQSSLKYFNDYNLVITTSGGVASVNYPTPITLPFDHTAVDLTSIEPIAAYRITALADVAIGDQLEARNVIGGTISDLTLLPDATFVVASNVTSFEVRAWSTATSDWGTYALQTIFVGGGVAGDHNSNAGISIQIALSI